MSRSSASTPSGCFRSMATACLPRSMALVAGFEWSTRPGGVDPVDAQHLGAHVGEQHPAERPRPEPDHLHDAQPLERTRH